MALTRLQLGELYYTKGGEADLDYIVAEYAKTYSAWKRHHCWQQWFAVEYS